MSSTATAPAPTPISSVPARKSKTGFQLRDTVLALITFFVALIGFVASVFIAVNAGGLGSSFWLGFSILFLVAIFVYVMWWVSHPRTNKWPGFIIGVIDLVLVIATMRVLFNTLSSPTFAWSKFWWGVLVALIFVGVFASIKVYGLLSRKLTK